MSQIITSFLTAFIISFLLIPIIIKVVKRLNILDTPGGRKIHTVDKPALGGVAIFIGFILSALVWTANSAVEQLPYFHGALLLVFCMGVRDDLVEIRALIKLCVQITAAFVVVYFGGVRITSLHGLFGFHEIPIWFSYFASISTIIVVTNAFNLIDGIDGLAGSIASLALSILGAWFFLIGKAVLALEIFALVGGIAGFLIFNWSPSKIFMGDTGSLFIGFFLSTVLITFIEVNEALPIEHIYHISSGIAFAVSVAIVPLFDTLRAFSIRIMKGNNPFDPDKNHLHHLLLQLGLTHGTATLVLLTGNVLAILFIYTFQSYTQHGLLIALLLGSIILSSLLTVVAQRRIVMSKDFSFLSGFQKRA